MLGKSIFNISENRRKIFNADSTEIVREMLKNCVENGTAKKLKNIARTLYAKTGTVGNENGNTDAYTISFNKEYITGVWFGNKDGEIMQNNITGGTLPCQVSNLIWEQIYSKKNYPPAFEIEHAEKKKIDKISYTEEKEVLLADDICEERYVIEELFIKNRKPLKQSTRFTTPNIRNVKILVNGGQ